MPISFRLSQDTVPYAFRLRGICDRVEILYRTPAVARSSRYASMFSLPSTSSRLPVSGSMRNTKTASSARYFSIAPGVLEPSPSANALMLSLSALASSQCCNVSASHSSSQSTIRPSRIRNVDLISKAAFIWRCQSLSQSSVVRTVSPSTTASTRCTYMALDLSSAYSERAPILPLPIIGSESATAAGSLHVHTTSSVISSPMASMS